MAKLKSRTLWPPYGFQMLFPQAGQAQPFSGSFNEVVTQTLDFLRKNPTLVTKHGWPTDQTSVEAWVDESNAARMIAHGWFDFVSDESGLPERTTFTAEKKTPFARLRSAVDGAKSIAAGVGVWIDLFGEEGKTVNQDVAERRAATCVKCPLNNTKTSLRSVLVEKAVQEVQQVYGILKNLELQTSHDAALGFCDPCLCPLRSKVWADISHIKNHLSDEVKAKLHPDCWVLSELKS